MYRVARSSTLSRKKKVCKQQWYAKRCILRAPRHKKHTLKLARTPTDQTVRLYMPVGSSMAPNERYMPWARSQREQVSFGKKWSIDEEKIIRSDSSLQILVPVITNALHQHIFISSLPRWNVRSSEQILYHSSMMFCCWSRATFASRSDSHEPQYQGISLVTVGCRVIICWTGSPFALAFAVREILNSGYCLVFLYVQKIFLNLQTWPQWSARNDRRDW